MTAATATRSAARPVTAPPRTSATPPLPGTTPPNSAATGLQTCPVCVVALRPFAQIDGGRLKDWFYNDRLRRVAARLHYGRCPRCGSIWAQDGRRDEALLTRIYAALPPQYWAEMADDAAFYASVDAILRTFAPGNRLCDVGCGDGKLLRGLGDHWLKHGLEPGVSAAERCRADGIPTLIGTPADALPNPAPAPNPGATQEPGAASKPGATPKRSEAQRRCADQTRSDAFSTTSVQPSPPRDPDVSNSALQTHDSRLAQVCPTTITKPFDALTYVDVIEHVIDPQRELTHLAAMLRPGGVLLVLTGDPTTRTARLAADCWEYLRWVGHVSILSRAALLTLLDSAGFEVLMHQTVDQSSSWSVRRWTWHWLRNGARRALGRPRRWLKHCRDHQLVVARRRPAGIEQ